MSNIFDIFRSLTGIFTLAGMDKRLFVSKYQLELPKVEELQRDLNEQRRLLEGGGA